MTGAIVGLAGFRGWLGSGGCKQGVGLLQAQSGITPYHLEGSRFVGWQLYRHAAGGSRKLPKVQLRREWGYGLERRMVPSEVVVSAGSFSGAACCKLIELPRNKAAPLQALPLRYRRGTIGPGVSHEGI